MENKIVTCIIADDERSGRDLLKRHIEKVPFLQLMRECKNAFEALSAISELDPDVIFLDIQMPGMNGFEMLALLSSSRPSVVVVSGDASFALEGFANEVVDYLLKPVTFERFAKAVLKTKKALDLGVTSILPSHNFAPLPASEAFKKEPVEDYLLVKDGKRFIRIDISAIQYVEAMKDYTRIHTDNSSTILHETMSRIEGRLPSPPFMRVHRSFIINKSIITEFEGNEIKTLSGKIIPIGSTYRDAMLAFLVKNIL